jgi:hypothetical protein
MKKHLLFLFAAFLLSQAATAQLPAAVPVNGLVAWYPLSGTANDAGPNALHGSNSGATPIYDRFGNSTGAMNFFSNYVIVPSNSLFNTGTGLSVSAWVALNSSATNQKIVGRTDLSFANGFIFAVENGQVYPEVWDNGGFHYTFYAGLVSSGAWDHLVMTWQSGGYMVIYVNGTAVDSMAASASPIGSNTDPLVIGGSPWSQSPLYFPVDGDLDDVGIWNRALTAQEVLALYQALPAGIREPVPHASLAVSLLSSEQAVAVNLPAANCLLSITDIRGKNVYSGMSSGQTAVLDCSDWTEGLYFVSATDSRQHRYSAKVVVTR